MSLFDTEERKLASLYRLSFAKIELDAPLKNKLHHRPWVTVVQCSDADWQMLCGDLAFSGGAD